MKNASRTSKVEGRIVNVSSEGHRFAYGEGIRFDSINDQSRYDEDTHLYINFRLVLMETGFRFSIGV